MLTFFTTGKPFLDHAGIIQRNALKSWTQVHADVEIILFGDEEGTAEVAEELGIRHEPYVLRSERGTKRLDYLFYRVGMIARHDVLCYINCDIVLLEDFCPALEKVRAAYAQFLMVGRRWDTEVTEAIDVSSAGWKQAIRQRALDADNRRPANWIDYFAFSRGLYAQLMPPFVIGRIYWDNWLVWRALDLDARVVDASDAVVAVHQNHDYGYHPQGKYGMWGDKESWRNFQLAGGHKHLRTIDSAQFRATPSGLTAKRWPWLSHQLHTGARLAWQLRRGTRAVWQDCLWHPLLDLTRPVRHRIGLNQRRVVPAFLRSRPRRYWLDE